MLVNLNDVLIPARRRHYAVGAFNTSNIELTQAIIGAAVRLRAPVIVAASEKAIGYAGLAELSSVVRLAARRSSIPVVLHLDHGSNPDIAAVCIKAGFSSVMIDASHLPYRENLKNTRAVVRFAHRRRVSVEAEIGVLAGVEDDRAIEPGMARYTKPDEAARFARDSGCDALAIAIGTSHGAYKFSGRPRLRIDILRAIARIVPVPLVLHGASSVESRWVQRANQHGARLARTRGVPLRLLQDAIRHGIAKINVDTDIRIAFTAGVRELLDRQPEQFDPRAIIGAGRDRTSEVIAARIRAFGSSGRG